MFVCRERDYLHKIALLLTLHTSRKRKESSRWHNNSGDPKHTYYVKSGKGSERVLIRNQSILVSYHKVNYSNFSLFKIQSRKKAGFFVFQPSKRPTNWTPTPLGHPRPKFHGHPFLLRISILRKAAWIWSTIHALHGGSTQFTKGCVNSQQIHATSIWTCAASLYISYVGRTEQTKRLFGIEFRGSEGKEAGGEGYKVISPSQKWTTARPDVTTLSGVQLLSNAHIIITTGNLRESNLSILSASILQVKLLEYDTNCTAVLW